MCRLLPVYKLFEVAYVFYFIWCLFSVFICLPIIFVELSRHIGEISSPFPPCGSNGLNSGCHLLGPSSLVHSFFPLFILLLLPSLPPTLFLFFPSIVFHSVCLSLHPFISSCFSSLTLYWWLEFNDWIELLIWQKFLDFKVLKSNT